MAQPCKVCSKPATAKAVASMIAEGLSDQAISDRVGGGIGRMAVQRHRKQHVERPAKALVEAANKGRDAADQRAATIAAAEAGDPAAFIGLGAIVNDLRRVQARLERTADMAEASGQATGVAAVSGQQIRAVEARARLGGIGGFGKEPAAVGGSTSRTIVFNFTGRPPVSITAGSTIEGDAVGSAGLESDQDG